MRDALSVYEAGLAAGALRVHVAGSSRARRLPVRRWLAPPGAVERRLLARLAGPVLDLGCGAGRHVRALVADGVEAMGVDISPAAVALARAAGAPVLHASAFDRLPGEGTWGSVLLLDGNLGMAGRPERLLRRAAELVRPGGAVVVELDPPGAGTGVDAVQLHAGDARSSWFAWGRMGADAIAAAAPAAGLGVRGAWADGGRWFADLRR